MDQRHGVRFAPRVLLHELFRLVALRIVQDSSMSSSDAGKNSLTLSTASGSFRAHSRASVCASSAWSSGRLS